MSESFVQSYLNKARNDKFLLSFNIPTALRKINEKFERSSTTINDDTVQFSVYGTIVPDIEVPAVEIRYSGNTLFQSAHSKNSFPPVTVDFTVDNRFNNYWVIYQWLNLLHNEKTGLFDAKNLIPDNNFDKYQTDIILTAFDEYQKGIITFTYTKAFPTSLGGINFSYREPNEITSKLTFVYSQLYINLIDV
ncbi:hypothetical protein EBU95_18590 [bacterium]|nr:hypothetical protein [bacterium]